MNYIDCHAHSNHSFDADDSVIDMVKAAVSKGLFAFAITDHCEADEAKMENNIPDISRSITEIIELKPTVETESFNLIAGIELGQYTQDVAFSKKVLTTSGIDFVIGSLHHATGYRDFFHVEFDKLSYGEIYAITYRYFKELLEIAVTANYDVLGHLTYPMRYINKALAKNSNLTIPIKHCDEVINQILLNVIKRGKGIEINTSTLATMGETMPTMKLLQDYHNCGGENITVGSDAHCVGNVGAGIEAAYEMLRTIGFEYVTYYKKRKPIQIKL